MIEYLVNFLKFLSDILRGRLLNFLHDSSFLVALLHEIIGSLKRRKRRRSLKQKQLICTRAMIYGKLKVLRVYPYRLFAVYYLPGEPAAHTVEKSRKTKERALYYRIIAQANIFICSLVIVV